MWDIDKCARGIMDRSEHAILDEIPKRIARQRAIGRRSTTRFPALSRILLRRSSGISRSCQRIAANSRGTANTKAMAIHRGHRVYSTGAASSFRFSDSRSRSKAGRRQLGNYRGRASRRGQPTGWSN